MGRGGTGVREASASSIEITFVYKGVRCRPRIKLKPTPANIRAVERHRDDIIEAIALDQFDYAETFPNCPHRHKFARLKGQVITVGHQLEQWLEHARPTLATSTYTDYLKIVNNELIAEFGNTALTNLSLVQVNVWASNKNVTVKTINNKLSPLRQCLNDALGKGLIEHNPLAGWTFKNRQARKTIDDVDPFTVAEQAAIIEKASPQGANLIEFAFWSGLRTSEYVALNWADIDLINGFVRVDKAHTQAAGKAEPTKTKAGTRNVKLLPKALNALLRQKEHTLDKGLEVFQNPSHLDRWKGDAPIRKRLWTPCLEQAEVRYRRPYQTRHTYASMMLSAGESPMWVAQQMGHTDWTMIARTYGRYIPESNPNAGNKAAELFGKDD